MLCRICTICEVQIQTGVPQGTAVAGDAVKLDHQVGIDDLVYLDQQAGIIDVVDLDHQAEGRKWCFDFRGSTVAPRSSCAVSVHKVVQQYVIIVVSHDLEQKAFDSTLHSRASIVYFLLCRVPKVSYMPIYPKDTAAVVHCTCSFTKYRYSIMNSVVRLH